MLKAEDKPKKTDKEKELLKKQKEKEKKEREKAKKEKERLKRKKEKEKKEREKAKKEKERLKKEKEKAKLAKQKEKESKNASTTESKKASTKKSVDSKKAITIDSKKAITIDSKKAITIDSKKIQGELIGKVYDPHDSPMASVYLTKNGFAFSCNTTGQAVESKNLWDLVEKDYLSVTDGKKWLNIRWARNKKFNIRTHTRPWIDKKPHWSKSEESAA